MRKFGKTDPSSPKERNFALNSGEIKSFIKENWLTLAFGLTVIIAVLMRTIFAVGASLGDNIALSGSSATEHKHTIISILTGTFGLSDPLLNYPLGGTLMQPPLVDFILAGFAWLPMALGVSASTAAAGVLALSGPVAAAITVLVVYYLGKEMFDRNIGMIAAFLFAVLPLSVVMSVFSDGTTMGVLVLFFALASLFTFRAMKALEATESRGIEAVLSKDILQYVLAAGAMFALIALSWNGFSMIIVLLIFLMAGHAVMSRLNSHDFGSALGAYAIMILLTLAISLPYYYATGLFSLVFTGPLLLSLIALGAVGLMYGVRRRTKFQTFIIPVLATVAVFIVLYFASPQLFNDVVSGNAIFESSLIANLLTPTNVGISKMASYYGWATVWMPFVMIAYMFYKLDKDSPSESHLMTGLWITGVFILSWMSGDNAIMAGIMYAIAASSALVLLYRYVDMSDYFKSLKGGGWKASLKKFMRPEPFVTLLSVIFLVIAPNAMLLADASTSSNRDVDNKYLGGVNYTVDTDENNPMNTLWDDYYNVTKEGALVTWFENSSKAVDRGGFTSVTSNSGQGATAVSNILLAEGSAGAISAMIVRMVLSEGMEKYEDLFDEDLVEGLNEIIDNPSKTKENVLKDQENYPGLASDVDEENAIYLASVRLITSSMNEPAIHQVYKEIRDISDGAIAYIALNANMLPMFQRDGSMFPSLAYLNDYALDSNGAVPKYFQHSYILDYTDAMFESFIWKSIIGINNETGINFNAAMSLIYSDGSVAANPGLGLSGFEVDYWQVKYHPDAEATLSDDGWVYLNGYEAIDKQKKEGGLINYLSSMIMMKVSDNYETETGRVTSDGEPVKGAKVAVFEKDPNGILTQRSTGFTDEDGYYHVLVPKDSSDYEFRLFVATDKTVGGTHLEYKSSADPDFELPLTTVTGKAEGIIGKLTVELQNVYTGNILTTDVDSNGDYAFTADPGKYTVSLKLNGKEINSASVTVYPGVNSGIDFEPSSTLKVTVKDIYGAPVDGEWVVLQNKYDGSVTYEETDGNGLAEFKVMPSNDNIENTGEYIVYVKDKVSTSSDVVVKGTSTTTSVTMFDTVTLTESGNFVVMAPGYSSYGQGDVHLPEFSDVTYTLLDIVNNTVRTVTDGVLSTSVATVEYEAQIKSKSDTDIPGSITFYGADGTTFTYVSDENGKVSAKLPAGNYTVHVTGKNGTVAIENDVNVPENKAEEPRVFKTDEGRTFKTKFTFNSGFDKTKGVPFAKVTVKVIHENKEYIVYGTTDTSGEASMVIPEDAKAEVFIEAGAIGPADELSWDDKTKDAGTDKSADFKLATKDLAYPKFDLKDKWLWTSKIDKKPSYWHESDKKEGDDNYDGVKVTPGTYYLVEYDENEDEYTYSKVKVYIGQDEFFVEPDTTVSELALVTVVEPEDSTVTVEAHPDSEDAEYFKVLFEADGDFEYLMAEGDYLFKAVKDDKIAYEPITIPGSTDVEFDLKDGITLKGYVGVDGNGFAEVKIGTLELFTEVKDGAYSVVVPKVANQATFDIVSLKYKPSGSEYTYEYGGSFDVTIPENPEDKDAPVITNAYITGSGTIADIDDKVELRTEIIDIDDKGFELELEIIPEKDAEGTKTYAVKSIGPWKLKESYVISVDGANSTIETIEGVFSPTNVNDRDHKMKVSIVDLEGKTVATGEIFDIYMPSANPKKEIDVTVSADNGAAPDMITDNEYRYAITFRNHDNDAVEVTLNVSGLGDGWIYALSDEAGKYLYTPDYMDKLVLAGNTKTVLYVKLMNSGGGPSDVPDITVGIDVDDPDFTVNGKTTLELESKEIVLGSDLSAEGNNVYDTGNAMQPIFWVFTVLSVILIVLIIWLGSKRGVFTRRK